VPEQTPKTWQTVTRFLILAGVLAVVVALVFWRIHDVFVDKKVLIPLIAGGVLALAGILANWNWLGDEILRRRTLVATNVVIMTVFAAALLAMANMVNYRHYVRKDLTKAGRYSLSSKTKNVVKGLKEPLTITTLFVPASGEDYEWSQEVTDLLEEYAAQSKNVKVVHVDAARNPTEVEQLSARLKIDSLERNSVIFERGTKAKHVPQSDTQEFSMRSMNPYGPPEPPKFKAEDAFTAAIIDVCEDKQTTLYFVTGHGEKDTGNYDRDGLSEVVKSVKRSNYKVEKLDLTVKKEIPADCDVLVIAGPTKRIPQDELDVVRTYLTGQQGKALIALEPVISSKQEPSGLEDLLRDFGVKVRTDLVCFNKIKLPLFGARVMAQVFVGEDGYGYHKITDKMKTESSSFFTACQVEAEGGETPGYRVTGLAKTLAEVSWGETSFADREPKYDEGKDVKGPVSLAVAVEPQSAKDRRRMPYGPPPMPEDEEGEGKGCRLVVFGDSDFIANQQTGESGAPTIFTNAISWLARKESQLGIPPKTPDIRTVNIQPKQMKTIAWSSVVGLPALGLLFGAIVWWRRRR